ncbi:hypothetical protein [Mycobacteroides chelonae]|uniref:hypothetical protein n=1 Tax=Mycobacteroides chelonae TaxID=1774 RepID=UPI0012FFC150|nr:hypothetical protein [Mycobacteroides chelonae]
MREMRKDLHEAHRSSKTGTNASLLPASTATAIIVPVSQRRRRQGAHEYRVIRKDDGPSPPPWV